MNGGKNIKEEYCVYAHKFPNEKYYIGLTRQLPEQRWGTNGFGYRKQPVYDAIFEFGWDNIEHIILADNLDRKEAQNKEMEFIKLFDSINNGYNVSYGGGCGGNPWCEYEYDGIIYTADELASMSIYDINAHDITNRINNHKWSIEKTINTPKGRKNITFEYKGKQLTIKQLYNIRINKSITYSQIKNRLLKYNWDVERAITQSNTVKNQPVSRGKKIYLYNGKMYNSYELLKLSNVEGLKVSDITCRINCHGWTVEDAITKPKKQKNIKFILNGKKYTSHELADISPFDNITYHDITDRIRSGWTVEKAVYTPKRK